MRTTLTLSILLTGLAFADPPKKQPLSRYSQLWTQSVMTTKPPPPETVTVNALDDWTLAGVVNDPRGPVVMMMKKADRKERVRIEPGVSNAEGFEVVDVKGSGSSDTVVVMRFRGQVGELRFDEKLATVQNAPRQAGPAPQQNRPQAQAQARNTNGAPPVPGLPNAGAQQPKADGKKKPRKRVRIVRPRSK